jgi:glycolate oxidase iron-sulfur subunit
MVDLADAAKLSALTDTCVHCGFCLPACPTYSLWGEEMDSPRGRIHLVRQAIDAGSVAPSVVGHLDACLGCLACVPACPSGVRYDQIIDQARVMVEAGAPRGRVDRAVRAGIFMLFPYRRRLRAVRPLLRLATRLRLTGAAGAAGTAGRPGPGGRLHLGGLVGIAGRIHPSLGALAQLAPPLHPEVGLAQRVPARPGGRPGPARTVVGLLTGCVQSAFFSHVLAATARVLSLEGCEVVVPRGQGCCGALANHVGRDRQAIRQARRIIATFERAGVEVIVTDVAGCGSAMKQYAHLLADDPEWSERAAALSAKVRDVTEVLVELGEPLAPRHPVPMTVAYHDACHLSHGQRVRSQPRQLLAQIPSLKVVPVADADTCCGSAGVYNLLQPEAANELGTRKAAALRASGARAIVAGNPGCLLQISAALRRDGGADLPTMHTVELIDASLTGTRPDH